MSAQPPHGSPSPPPEPGPALPGRRPRGVRGWPWWIAPLALLSGFALVIIVSLFAGIIAAASGVNVKKDLPSGLQVGLTVFQNVAFFAMAFFFARSVSRRAPRASDFGLRRPPSIPLSAALLFAVWGAFVVITLIWTGLLGDQGRSNLPEELGVDESAANLVIATFLVTVVAPVGEELFFRGFFFGALRNWKGPWPAAIATGVVFGAIHIGSAPAVQLLPLAVFGIGLCMLYHWTESLYPCIVLHALSNSVSFGYLEGWRWEIPLVMAGSVLVSLLVAVGIQRGLDAVATGRGRPAAPLAAG